MIDDRAVGVAGHVDHPQVGARGADDLGHAAPAHAGHHDVGEHDVDRGLGLAALDDRVGPVDRLDDGVAPPAQGFADDGPRFDLIFDHEHGLRAGERGRRQLAGGLRRELLGRDGQVDLERGAVAELAVHPDRAAALRDDAVHGGQPQAGAAAGLLRGEERLEEALLRGGVHAGTGIGDRHHDVRSRGGAGVLGHVVVVEHGVRGLDRQLAAVRHRVAGVHREVENHLLDLAWVGADPADRGGELHRELDVLADDALQQRIDTRQHLVEVERLRLQDLAPAEREQLARQALRALSRGADLPDVDRRRVVGPEVLQHQLAVAEDGRQQVVEIVGDAAGEAPDRFHLLRLQQLLLGAPHVGDVLGQSDHPVELAAGVVDRERAGAHPAGGAVGTHHAEVTRDRLALLDRLPRLADHRGIVGMDRLDPGAGIAVRLFERPAPDLLPHAVQIQRPVAIELDDQERFLDVLGNLPEPFFTGPQPLFGALPIGQVDDGRERGLAAAPRDRRRHALEQNHRAVALQQVQLELVRGRPAVAPRLGVGLRHVAVLRRDELPDQLPDQVVGALEPEHRRQGLVGETDDAVHVNHHALDRALDQVAIQSLAAADGLIGRVPLDRVADGAIEQRAVDFGLDEVVLRALAHRTGRHLLVGEAGENDDRRLRGFGARAQEGVHPLAVGQIQIEQDRAEPLRAQAFEGVAQPVGVRQRHRMVRVLQHLAHEARVGRIVLDQQDLQLRGYGSVRRRARHGRASLTTSSQNCSSERTTWKKRSISTGLVMKALAPSR